MIITVIGLGLIGGSMAIDAQQRKISNTIIGVDANPKNAEIALKNGIVTQIDTLENAVKQADLVIVAIPVKLTAQLLPTILYYTNAQTVVTDVGSTKTKIIESVALHPHRDRFVASHPMAGTENSGPLAAQAKLFDEKAVIICDKEQSSTHAIQTIEKYYTALNMHLVYMTAEEHDKHTAYISHISHISSFVLANTVLIKEKEVGNIFNLASGGFESTVRLAKSSPQMWSQIFEQNAYNILEVIDTYIEQLSIWRNLISRGHFKEIEKQMTEANTIRKILQLPASERIQLGNTNAAEK